MCSVVPFKFLTLKIAQALKDSALLALAALFMMKLKDQINNIGKVVAKI